MSTRFRPLVAFTACAAILASLSLPGSRVLASGPSSRAVQVCWDFSTLSQANQYRIGDIFVAPNATIEMKNYLWNGNKVSSANAVAYAQQSQIAGGPAPEFRLYVLNAHVEPNTPVNNVTYSFALNLAPGNGHANVGVNGELVEVTTNLASLNGRVLGDPAIGTAQVTVTLVPSPANWEKGTLELQAMTGQIEKFSIGGVEKFIDNVCMQ